MAFSYEVVPSEGVSGWHPEIDRFWRHLAATAPPTGLPGRQHFDPVDVPWLLPRLWVLDVLRDPLRFRYRVVGTKEVETIGRDPTGLFLDDVHPKLRTAPEVLERYRRMAEDGVATWRRGRVAFLPRQEHRTVENLIQPFARDGRTPDMLFCCSVVFREDGSEV